MIKETFRQPRRTAVDAAPPEVGLNPGLRAELHELSDNALLAQVRTQPRDSELRAAACEILVDRYTKLVRACVRQYRGSPEPIEDLIQVGYVGLLKAINNYDPEVGDSLAAYAQPCVYGEIKRHFRDKRWQIHVRRSAQELLLELRKANEDLTHQLGRTPEEAELAHRLGVSEDDMQEARQADLVFSTYSLDAPLSDRDDPALLADLLGDDDPGVAHVHRHGSPQRPLGRAAGTRAAHPGAALLRQPHPDRDRRPARHLADARLQADGTGPGPPEKQAA